MAPRRMGIRAAGFQNRAARTTAAALPRDRRVNNRAARRSGFPSGRPAGEFGEEFAGLKLLAGARDGVGSAHVCQLTNASKLDQPSEICELPEVATGLANWSC